MIRPDISARMVGAERQPVAMVDGFHPDPDALRAVALAARFGPGLRLYPGIRADLPIDYFHATRTVLEMVVSQVFGAREGATLIDASFSIVTRPPGELSVQQCIPHVDGVEPGRIGLVHYLSPQGGDGTAFFRHRATGFEALDAARSPTYLAQLNRELDGAAPPVGYMAEGNALFERTAHVEGRYNRAVIYRSAMLHSGAITPGATLSSDPATGRLTVTAFLMAR